MMLSMKKNNSFLFTVSGMLIMVFLATVGCSGNAIGEDGAPAISVNDEIVTQAELEVEIDQAYQQQAQMMEMQGQQIDPEQEQMFRDHIRQQVIEQNVNRLILLSSARETGVQVDDVELDSFLNERLPDSEQQRAALLEMGETIEEGRENLKEMLRIQKFMEQEIGDIEITEQEAREHFEQHSEQYGQPEQVKASHILLETEEQGSAAARQKLEEMKEEIEAGADFSELARQHSTCPSGQEGGDLGFFGREQMVPEFSEAAFAAAPGQVVGPVETQFGMHIILVEERREADQQDFESVEQEIVQRLQQQRQQEAAQQLLDELRADKDINISE